MDTDLKHFEIQHLKIIKEKDDWFIWDILRKKYIHLSPEELVRQNIIHLLTTRLNYPKAHIKAEHGFKHKIRVYKSDLVIYDCTGKILMLVECKSPYNKIVQENMNQIIKYNQTLKANYILLTNGYTHSCYQVKYLSESNVQYINLSKIPCYPL